MCYGKYLLLHGAMPFAITIERTRIYAYPVTQACGNAGAVYGLLERWLVTGLRQRRFVTGLRQRRLLLTGLIAE